MTPEDAPLALFGPRASEFAADLLARHGIDVIASAGAVAARDGSARARRWPPAGRRARDRASARARAAHRGHPARRRGLRPDRRARACARAWTHVYAAGDVTNFPFKQGGLAAQQADAAAEAMLAELGLPIAPRPFDPVIRGVLFTDGEPAYLQAPLAPGAARPSDPRAYSLWWPPSKIAGRHLSPYLAMRAGRAAHPGGPPRIRPRVGRRPRRRSRRARRGPLPPG